MSYGKYSPYHTIGTDYSFTCYGKVPTPWTVDSIEAYDEKIHFANYDKDGFDRYGYSGFDVDGNYVGISSGVDRNGYFEHEYMCMSEDEFANV